MVLLVGVWNCGRDARTVVIAMAVETSIARLSCDRAPVVAPAAALALALALARPPPAPLVVAATTNLHMTSSMCMQFRLCAALGYELRSERNDNRTRPYNREEIEAMQPQTQTQFTWGVFRVLGTHVLSQSV
jgi:hypothetical protein